MTKINYTLRQAAALSCAFTLAWDYRRDPDVLGLFSVWTLGLHFIYFQLPLKSRALAYLHAISFTACGVMLPLYCHLLMWKPSLETDRMELWDVSFSTIVTRSGLIYFAPVLFHALDVSFNQMTLIASYQMKPRKLMYGWSLASFAVFGLIYNMVYPESEETNNIPGIDSRDFLLRCRILSILSTGFTFTLLYSLILRRAYPKKHRSLSR
jgi:hypothetical protein